MKPCSNLSIFNLQFSIAVAICFLCAGTALAQGVPINTGGLTLTVSSNNPSPNQQIKITAQSYSLDINSATVTWTVNGKREQQGAGLTTLSVSAPALGKTTIVSVTAVTPDGQQVSDSVTIGSGSIDLIIEPNGYVPPFFTGKLAISHQNTVTVTAVPHMADSSGKEYDPKTLVYQWRKDSGAVFQDQSGYGKQSISLKSDLVSRPYYLMVSVSPRSGSARAEGMVLIDPQAPSLNFYVNDSLYGPLYNKSVANVRIGSEKETGVLVVPYGFNGSISDGSLSMNWRINNTSHPELASGKSIILRSPEGQAGSSIVKLVISNTKDILQSAEAGFMASFSTGKPSSASSPATF